MRVWFVSELYYPEETSTGYLLTRLAEGVARDFEVGALCSQPTYSARGTRGAASEVRHGVRISRCRGTTLDKNALLGRLVNIATISLSMFAGALARFRRGDTVIVVTNPPLLPCVVLLACRLRGAKSVLLVHDVYPEAAVAAGLLRDGSMAERWTSAVARALYRAFDRVVILGRDMGDLVSRKLGTRVGTIAMIPNWADTDSVSPGNREANPLLVELGLASRWVAQYAGNMGRTHGLDVLVDCAALLRQTSPDSHFLFIGSGARMQWLKNVASREGAPNITVLPNRPRSDQQNFLNACDVAIISFRQGMSGVSVPSRMYNILAAGKPIIAVADDDSELALVVREEEVGWVVPPGRADLLAQILVSARQDQKALRAMSVRARRAAEKYTLKRAVDSYACMLAELDPASGLQHRSPKDTLNKPATYNARASTVTTGPPRAN